MGKLFYCIPFLMLGGTAWQGTGLYLFAILLPWFFLRKSRPTGLAQRWRSPLLLLALSLVLMFVVFPLANFMNLLLGTGELLRDLERPVMLSLRTLSASQFSSAFPASALFLVLLVTGIPWMRNSMRAQAVVPGISGQVLFRNFTRGMLAASIVLAAYCFYQHLYGVDWLAPGRKLSETKFLSGSGAYRVPGFFSHPLSLAGSSLALFSFYLVLLCRAVSHRLTGQGDQTERSQVVCFALVALLQFLFVILSGGRFAVLTALGILLVCPFLFVAPGRFLKIKGLATGFAGILATVIVFATGLMTRFIELWNHVQAGQPERLRFWKVYWYMISEKPWFGHGYAWLKNWSRDIYYERLGYGDMEHKYNAHNMLLEILGDTGLAGLAVILASLLLLLLAVRYMAVFSGRLALWPALLLAFFANCVNGLTQNTFFDSNVMFIYLYLLWVMIWCVLTSGPVSSGEEQQSAGKPLIRHA